MKKIKIILVAAVIASLGVLPSCSSDEPTPMEIAKNDVAGTKWIGYDSHLGPMTMTFTNKSGLYTLESDNFSYSIGSYQQRGAFLTLKQTTYADFFYKVSSATVTNGGGTLIVPLYNFYSGEHDRDLKFVLCVTND